MVQDEAREKDMQQSEAISHLQQENSLMQQKIDSLEKYLSETKESLNKVHLLNTEAMDSQLTRFDAERKELNLKIEEQAAELGRKERLLTTTENKKDSIEQQLKAKDEQLKEIVGEVQGQKSSLQEKLEEMRAKHQNLLDDQHHSTIDLEKEKALMEQRLKFNEDKIATLQKQNEDQTRMYEERIKSDREELYRDFNDRIERMKQEKEAAESKYEIKRKALKELENSSNKSNASKEREHAVMKEKYENLEK